MVCFRVRQRPFRFNRPFDRFFRASDVQVVIYAGLVVLVRPIGMLLCVLYRLFVNRDRHLYDLRNSPRYLLRVGLNRYEDCPHRTWRRSNRLWWYFFRFYIF